MSLIRSLLARTAQGLAYGALQLLGPRQRIRVLERLAENALTTTAISDGQIRFCTPSSQALQRAQTVLTKEPETIRWIEGFDDGDVLWDVGANVGVYSLYAALRKKATVCAFEPMAGNYHLLTTNIQLNELCDQITAYCVAFADQTQLGLLHLASPAMGAALSQFGSPDGLLPWNRVETHGRHGMLGFSIDDFVERYSPHFPHHLKIDVDGIELQILRGARNTLADPRLKSLLVELPTDNALDHEAALDLLQEAGLHVVGQGDIQMTPTAEGRNFVFARANGSADHSDTDLQALGQCP